MMPASALQCRGLGSARLPMRPPGPAAVTSTARRSLPRVVCQQATDQAPGTSAPAPEAVDASPPPYPMPVSPAPGSVPEGASTAYYAPPPGYQPYQMQQRVPQEYYMAPPPGYYTPPPAYKAQESSSGAPWWIWVGVGILAANIIGKVQEYMKNPKSPQQMMTEMAMKQMMGAMSNQTGGASPFGKAGMPPFPGGMPPFPPGGFAQAAAAAAPAAPAVDITSSSSSSTEKKGEKFAARMGSPSGSTTSTSTSPSSSTTGASNDASTPKAASFMDVVEPIVKEPPSSSSSSSRSAASFFADAATASSSQQSARNTGSTPGGDNGASAGASTSGAEGSGSVMSEMMENMLRNPEMQKMLYPYLPEPMRNPQSIEWMLNNPEVKKQMTAMFEQQNMMSPQMMEMMKGMDFNQDKVNKQFQELGLKPEDVISKVMSNPELAAGFQSPKVQAAIMDISQNPMNVMKYQNDPEVMKVLEQVTTLFQPDMAAGQR